LNSSSPPHENNFKPVQLELLAYSPLSTPHRHHTIISAFHPSTVKAETRSIDSPVVNADVVVHGLSAPSTFTRYHVHTEPFHIKRYDLTVRPVQKAAIMMGNKRVGSLLVIRRKGDVGIITERDIMSKVIAKKFDLDEVKVKEVMSKPLIAVDKDTHGEEVIKVMARKGVRRVLVIDEDKIVGIFSTSDVTKLARTSQ